MYLSSEILKFECFWYCQRLGLHPHLTSMIDAEGEGGGESFWPSQAFFLKPSSKNPMPQLSKSQCKDKAIGVDESLLA